MSQEKNVFIEPSAAGPTQKIGADGVITPGSAHEAKEGKVTNAGVRTVSVAHAGPRCPMCNESTLKMRMNRPAGKRAYCSNKSCSYDQGSIQVGVGGIKPNPMTTVIDGRGARGSGEVGVKIIKQSGPR